MVQVILLEVTSDNGLVYSGLGFSAGVVASVILFKRMHPFPFYPVARAGSQTYCYLQPSPNFDLLRYT